MITYSWNFPLVDVAPSTEGGLTNVIKVVHWELWANDGSGHYARLYGTHDLADADPSEFTAIDKVTSDQLVAWVSAGMDIDAAKAALATQIANAIDPPIVAMTLDLGSSAAAPKTPV